MTFSLSLLLTSLTFTTETIIKLVRKNNRNTEYIHIDTKKVCLKIFSVLLRLASATQRSWTNERLWNQIRGREEAEGRVCGVCVWDGGRGQDTWQDTWPHTLGQETRQAERSTSPKQVGIVRTPSKYKTAWLKLLPQKVCLWRLVIIYLVCSITSTIKLSNFLQTLIPESSTSICYWTMGQR